MSPNEHTHCGRWYSLDFAESKGPRGGRRTSTMAVCSDCLRESELHADTKPGRRDGAHAAVRELNQHQCPTPRRFSEREHLLRTVVRLLLDGQHFGVREAIEHGVGPGGLEPMLDAAWTECRSGVLMAEVWGAAAARGQKYIRWPWRAELRPNGIEAVVRLVLPHDVEMQLSGPDTAVANAVRQALPSVEWKPVLDALGMGARRTA